MKKIITFLIILICFFSCKTEAKINVTTKKEVEVKEEVKKNEIKYVTAKSGLNYRNKPKGEVLGKFEYGEELEIIKHSNIFESITDENGLIKGEWLGININDKMVYTFSGFLSNDKPILKSNEKLYTLLLPSTYRTWKNENPADYIDNTWTALFKKDVKYYIEKANYTIEKGEDACSGLFTKTIKTQNKTLLFYKNSNINFGEVYHQEIQKNKIWPGEEMVFNYNNNEYKIRAEGDFTSPKEALLVKNKDFYADVINYKLYISINNKKESLFLEEKSFNDTFVEMLFVGDIDTDGKLDFIFQANRNYEEERVILFLSSKATEKEIIKKSGEIAIQFDC